MSTFAAKSFDAAAYARARPTYPPQLFHHVLSALPALPTPTATSHPKPRTLLDLGCGPGLSTFEWGPLLPNRFERVVGIDPSPGMITTARSILADKQAKGELGDGGKADWRFEVARSDELRGVVEDESVDLAIAGQAAHWFDAEKTYKELARVLKPGGAFAFWGYGEFFFPDRPELSTLISPYSSGTLGPYWEQPGRSIVEALLTPIPFPTTATSLAHTSKPHDPSPRPSTQLASSELPAHVKTPPPPEEALKLARAFDDASFKRLFFLRPNGGPPPLSAGAASAALRSNGAAASPVTSQPEIEVHRQLLLTREWDLAALRSYLLTWSAAHSFNAAHSSARSNFQSGIATTDRTSSPVANGAELQRGREESTDKKDCTEVFCEGLRRAGLTDGEKVEVAWELGVMVGRKRE
ncbi:hypothetical protein JCM6882_007364 [Rhodosporidiobolus microsporus]